MNIFNKKQNTTVSQNSQDPDVQLAALVAKTKKLNKDIDDMSKQTKKNLDNIETEVDEKSGNIDDICADLDKADKKAESEFDQLAIDEVDESEE